MGSRKFCKILGLVMFLGSVVWFMCTGQPTDSRVIQPFFEWRLIAIPLFFGSFLVMWLGWKRFSDESESDGSPSADAKPKS
jgi:preprotein translocase subunit SecY